MMRMSSRGWAPVVALSLILFASGAPRAFAWGDRGHEITALIAWQFMTPTTQQRVMQILATDDSGLAGPTIAAQSTWADKYRDSDRDEARVRYRQTFRWHFINLDLDNPDFNSACFAEPAAHTAAFVGAERACIVDKIDQFEHELLDRTTDDRERLRALQFVLHLIGDLHQPLHASNNDDDGGNRVRVIVGANNRMSLHGYWDGEVVRRLGRNVDNAAATLAKQISTEDISRWQRGTAREWAIESWRIARGDIYRRLPEPLADGNYRLDNHYQNRAKEIARLQLQRGGVRLALVLNRTFDSTFKNDQAPR